jgi:hypothetical protein
VAVLLKRSVEANSDAADRRLLRRLRATKAGSWGSSQGVDRKMSEG